MFWVWILSILTISLPRALDNLGMSMQIKCMDFESLCSAILVPLRTLTYLNGLFYRVVVAFKLKCPTGLVL